MNLIKISKPNYVYNLSNFKNFVLNIDNPKLISKEYNFLIKLSQELDSYSLSQLFVLFFHKSFYQVFDEFNFNFKNIYNSVCLGLETYKKFKNVNLDKIELDSLSTNFLIRQILSKSINELLLYFWFYLPPNLRFDNQSFLTTVAKHNTLTNSLKCKSFNILINQNFPLEIQWNYLSFQFKNVFLMKLLHQFDLRII